MGFDRETDARIEIGEGNLTRNGLEIRIYDWADNQYHRVTITSFNENSARTEIEVFDEETGEERIFDMERSK